MQLNSISIDNKSVIMRVTANKETDDTKGQEQLGFGN